MKFELISAAVRSLVSDARIPVFIPWFEAFQLLRQGFLGVWNGVQSSPFTTVFIFVKSWKSHELNTESQKNVERY